jgi:DNA repair exonuclease SbcCD ATPase subunit
MDDISHQIDITLEYPISVETILNISFSHEGFKMVFEFILDILRKHEAALKKFQSASSTESKFLEEIEKLRSELFKTQESTESLRLDHSNRLNSLDNSQQVLENNHQDFKKDLDALKDSVYLIETTQKEKFNDIESKIESLTSISNANQRNIDNHDTSLKEIYARLDKNEEEISKQLRSLDFLRKELDGQSERLDKTERNVMETKESLENHTGVLNDHEKRLHQLETDIDQAMKAIKSLGGEVQQISKPSEPVVHEVVSNQDNSKYDSLWDNIKDLSKLIKDIDLRLTNNEDNTSKTKDLAEKTDNFCKKLNNDLKDLQDALQRLEDLARRPQGKPGDVERSSSDVSRSDLESLKKLLKQLEDNLKSKASLEDLNSIKHVSTGQAVVPDLKGLRELQHRVDELQKSIQSLPKSEPNKFSGKELQDLTSRVESLEKHLAGLLSRLDDVGNRLSGIEVSLNKKSNKSDLDDLKKLISSQDSRPVLKSDDSVDSSKLTSFSRRLGYVEEALKLLTLPEGYDIIAIFNIVIKVQAETKEFKDKSDEYFKKIFSKLKELEDLINKKANIEDLKALDEFIRSKLKELADEFSKKFAEKIETKKALKYLEKMIKDNETFKAIPEGDDAMLARKPLGGWSCASCQKELEKLIGKVAPYHPWNKLPYRDPADRIARAGPGFSRMLATIQPESFTNRTRGSAIINNSPPISNHDEDVVESITLPPVKKAADRPLTTL